MIKDRQQVYSIATKARDIAFFLGDESPGNPTLEPNVNVLIDSIHKYDANGMEILEHTVITHLADGMHDYWTISINQKGESIFYARIHNELVEDYHYGLGNKTRRRLEELYMRALIVKEIQEKKKKSV